MALYCTMCGDELAPEEEHEGICESCKLSHGDGLAADETEADIT